MLMLKQSFVGNQKRVFSRMDRLKSEFAKEASEGGKSGANKQTIYFPFVTLALTGTSIYIYYKWTKMTPR